MLLGVWQDSQSRLFRAPLRNILDPQRDLKVDLGFRV